MKRNVFNFILPMAVVVFGLASAFTTHDAATKIAKSGAVWGYKHIAGAQPCQQIQMCSNSGSFVCKSNIDSSVLYALTAPNVCPNQLFRDTP